MPRSRRPENRPLPRRWQWTHGAYYFRVPKGQEAAWEGRQRFRLGSTLAEAAASWAQRMGQQATPVRTIAELLDRYELEVVPAKAPSTQGTNRVFIRRLRAILGALPLAGVTPQLVYQYRDRRAHKVAAHREIEILSHAYTKAVEWGYLARHPFKGEVRLPGERPRTRYIEDWEVVEMLALPARRGRGSVLMIQAYIRLKILTGLARGDLLRLRAGEHLRDDGIHVTRHKTGGRSTIYEWTADRREALERAKRVRPALSPFLFCNRRGEGYVDESTGTCNGFDSMWGRFVDRVLAETKVTERFTEHDLRAKVGSDAESLERARALLQHADARTTERIYRRKPERV